MTEPVLDEIARRYRLVAADRAVDGTRVVTAASPSALPEALAVDLYTRVHARSVPAVVGTADAPHTPASAAEFLGGPADEGTFADAGWTVRSPADRLVVKDGLVLRVPHPARGVPDRLAGAGPGASCAVDLPCERRAAVPGCYLRLGAAGPCPPGAAARVYLHPVAERAGTVFAQLCRELDAAGVRFGAKVFNSPHRCRRADAIVVEFAAPDRAAVLAAAGRAGPLEPDVPGFCDALGHGIGYAEQAPGATGRSLGQDRARLAAGGLVTAFRDGAADVAGRRRALAEAFRRGGVDDARPWTVAGTGDRTEAVPG